MKRRKFRVMLACFAASYLVALWWVFTRSAPIVSSRPVTIRFAHWQIEKGPPDGFDAVIRRYEQLNPRVKVEQVAVPGIVYRQWVRTNLTGGTGTDLMEFGYWLLGMNDVPVRYFEPLTRAMNEPNPYNRGTPMEKVPWRQTFDDGLYGMLSQSPEIGQIYGATLSQGSTRLFCNRELLRKITGSAAPPATFADFRALCVKVADYSRRTNSHIHPLAGSYHNAQWLTDFLMIGTVTGLNLELDREGYLSRAYWQAQSDYLQGRWNYHRPEIKAGLEMVREMAQQMRPGFAQLSRDDALQEFVRGEALFIYSGSFDATTIQRVAPFTVQAMHLPQPTKDDPVVGPYIKGRFQDGYLGTGFEMYLNKNSPHKEAALDFLRFMTSVEGGQLFMDHSGWLSSIRGVKVPPEMEIYRGSTEGYSSGVVEYVGVGSNSNMAFWQHLNLLVSPQGSVEQFVDAVEVGLRQKITADLRVEIHTMAEASRAVDSEVVAMTALNRLRGKDAGRDVRLQTLASNQTLTEISEYEAEWALRRHGDQP
jgi:ABC-type glycerol-3-phosphate transport system substrate-binding protein